MQTHIYRQEDYINLDLDTNTYIDTRGLYKPRSRYKHIDRFRYIHTPTINY